MKKLLKTQVLDYLQLDLKKLPDFIKNSDGIDLKASEIKNEKNYKVYKYVPIKDIDIVITNASRIDEPSEKIKKMNTLTNFFNKKNEEEYSVMLNLLENASISDIEYLEQFQNNLKANNIPSKIKFTKDYIWQIYYIKRTNKYYMIVPIQETELQAFFYVLKKKIEESNEKIYVPICNLNYNNSLIENSKINTLENNLYFFTNNWPLTYEVYDTQNDVSIKIVGEFEILQNITTDYVMTFDNSEDIKDFYNLVKTLAFIQTELSNYFKFDISIDSNGKLYFSYGEDELLTSNLQDFYKKEINNNIKNVEEIQNIQTNLSKKLEVLKLKEEQLNSQLHIKEKQISTFLECRKTFFGKIRYFLKYSKKKNIDKQNDSSKEEKDIEQKETRTFKTSFASAQFNDLEDLIYICKELRNKTTIAATTRLDVQNLETKIEILNKKIENADNYIKEIDSHKKSIFEFWKFINKDQKNQLAEGSTKTNNKKQIEKNFNIKDDLIEFSKKMDLLLRKNLTEDELEAILLAVSIGESNINQEDTAQEILDNLSNKESLLYFNLDLVDHREKIKDPRNIINFENISIEDFSKKLLQIRENLNSAFKKCKLKLNLPVYSLEKPENKIMKFEIDPKKLLNSNVVNMYKLNLKLGINILPLSNIVFFFNRNQTLPLGMDYSTEVLVDLEKINLIKIKRKTHYIIKLSDFSPNKGKKEIIITEYNI